MADKIYNAGLALIGAGLHFENADLRALLVMSDTTADTENAGVDVLDDFSDLDEADGANYARVSLTGVSYTRDDGNNRATFDANDVVFTELGACTRDVVGCVIYLHDTDDTASVPIFFLEFEGTPNGLNFTVEFDAAGIAHIRQGQSS